MIKDEIRANPLKTDPPETTSTLIYDAKRNIGTGARRGELYFIFKEPSPSTLPGQDTNSNTTETSKTKPFRGQGPVHGPKGDEVDQRWSRQEAAA